MDVAAKRAEIDRKIKALQNDIENNFSLSRMQLNNKKREINILNSEKSKL